MLRVANSVWPTVCGKHFHTHRGTSLPNLSTHAHVAPAAAPRLARRVVAAIVVVTTAVATTPPLPPAACPCWQRTLNGTCPGIKVPILLETQDNWDNRGMSVMQ